jgi:hypothetical protein
MATSNATKFKVLDDVVGLTINAENIAKIESALRAAFAVLGENASVSLEFERPEAQGTQQEPEIVWVTYNELGERQFIMDCGALSLLGFETLSNYAA